MHSIVNGTNIEWFLTVAFRRQAKAALSAGRAAKRVPCRSTINYSAICLPFAVKVEFVLDLSAH